ncbi:MAG: CPBP family intramembrane metalloprotease [Clostridiales bacterium]|nr:CPBP family intramembrane metalloprotease [Clostridiales bacterium]
MQNTDKRKRIWNVVQIIVIAVFCTFTLAMEFVCRLDRIDSLRETMVCKLAQQLCGATAAILLMIRLKLRLFGKPQKWLYLLPCLAVAVANFQFSAYFSGKMQLIYNKPTDILLFAGYCLSVGLFEEMIFRGVVFAVLAGVFAQSKKGFVWTYVVSSLVFGFAHLVNGFSLGTLLQIGYSILTGGLFAFCMIKTKNIFCCALVHGMYNFCGLLFETFDPISGTIGLGAGVVFDLGTVITMLIVDITVGVFVLCKVLTYSEQERVELYQKLAITAQNER